MAGRRIVTLGAVGLAGGAGYYLYTAGGDAKVAEKNFECEVAQCNKDYLSLTVCS